MTFLAAARGRRSLESHDRLAPPSKRPRSRARQFSSAYHTHLGPPSSRPLHRVGMLPSKLALGSCRLAYRRLSTGKGVRAPVLTEQVLHLALPRVQRQVAAEYDAAHRNGSGPVPRPARRTLGPCYLLLPTRKRGGSRRAGSLDVRRRVCNPGACGEASQPTALVRQPVRRGAPPAPRPLCCGAQGSCAPERHDDATPA